MSRISATLKSLSPAAEFRIVFLLAFAWPLLMSQLAIPGPEGLAPIQVSDLRALVVQEVLVLGVLGWFLAVRGWDLAGLIGRPSWIDCAFGLAFGIAFFYVWDAVWTQIQYAFVPAPLPLDWAPGLDWPTLLAVSLVNPLFEELLVCGYVVSALRSRQGVELAIAISVAIRAAYHTYQGAEGVMATIVLGTLCCLWFCARGGSGPSSSPTPSSISGPLCPRSGQLQLRS